jgi:DNA polymerase
MTASRRRYLAAMGIPLWVSRGGSDGATDVPAPASPEAASNAVPARAGPPEAGFRQAGSADAPERARQLEPVPGRPRAGRAEEGRTSADPGAGLEADVRPGEPARQAAARADASRRSGSGLAGGAEAAWTALAAEVSRCTACALHTTRTQTVFGVGRRDADLLVIGEAPGADEDRQGEPFVGRAGQLLNAMLRAIGLDRAQCYIANVLKCRPPGNRDPKPEESATCTPFLERQIALIEPRAILAVGRISAQWLLQTDQPIGRLRGQVHSYGARGIPLVVTYHPAYLLRTPLAKAKSWTDLCLVRDLIASSR